MPMNETLLLRRLQRRIGSKLYNCVDEQCFMDVLNEETLETINSSIAYLEKFTNYENINISMESIDKDKTITKVCDNVIVIVPLKDLVNVEEEIKKQEELLKTDLLKALY